MRHLRRHLIQRPRHHRHLPRLLVVSQPGELEISEVLIQLPIQPKIAGFDVSMQYRLRVVLVQVRQRCGHSLRIGCPNSKGSDSAIAKKELTASNRIPTAPTDIPTMIPTLLVKPREELVEGVFVHAGSWGGTRLRST